MEERAEHWPGDLGRHRGRNSLMEKQAEGQVPPYQADAAAEVGRNHRQRVPWSRAHPSCLRSPICVTIRLGGPAAVGQGEWRTSSCTSAWVLLAASGLFSRHILYSSAAMVLSQSCTSYFSLWISQCPIKMDILEVAGSCVHF